MEIELAVSAMARKANKFYSTHRKQIESLFSAIEAKKGKHLIRGNTLVSSVLLGFVEAQDTIRINLEIRLVFMKLFEQHFLMNLEKLFLDNFSILNNIDNKKFIDRLLLLFFFSYAGCYQLHTKRGGSAQFGNC